MIKNPPAMWETWVRSLGWEDPLERAWQPTPVFWPGVSPGTEEPGGLQSMGWPRVKHDWASKHSTALDHYVSFILHITNLSKFSDGSYLILETQLNCCSVAKSCPTLCDLMDCSPTGSSVHGIFQARTLEWVAMPSPGDLPNPEIACIAGGFFTN